MRREITAYEACMDCHYWIPDRQTGIVGCFRYPRFGQDFTDRSNLPEDCEASWCGEWKLRSEEEPEEACLEKETCTEPNIGWKATRYVEAEEKDGDWRTYSAHQTTQWFISLI